MNATYCRHVEVRSGQDKKRITIAQDAHTTMRVLVVALVLTPPSELPTPIVSVIVLSVERSITSMRLFFPTTTAYSFC